MLLKYRAESARKHKMVLLPRNFSNSGRVFLLLTLSFSKGCMAYLLLKNIKYLVLTIMSIRLKINGQGVSLHIVHILLCVAREIPNRNKMLYANRVRGQIFQAPLLSFSNDKAKSCQFQICLKYSHFSVRNNSGAWGEGHN